MFKNILLAYDGSEHAIRAAHLAGDLARENDADLRVVVIFESTPAYLGEPEFQHMITARIHFTEKILEDALEEVGEIAKEIKTEMMEGPPAVAILNIAKTRGNDLIVMGTRGRGKLSGLLLGSVSQKVVAHAPCPVLLVR